MRYNGLVLLINRAVRELGDPVAVRHRKALILGSIREDVMYVPGLRIVWEHLSFSHFYKSPLPGGFIPFLWPGAPIKASLFFRRALREFGAGREASAYVQLGRAAHLVADMACPVHVHRRIHETDLYEWYVDAHRPELEELPMPEVPPCDSAAAVIRGLSDFTKQHRGDPTQHPLGRFLKRRGVLKSVPKAEVVEQARAIIPMACAYTASLLDLFRRRRSS